MFLAIATLAVPAFAAGTAAPDPLLSESKGPCDPKLDGPDYVAGTDVDGNPVAPANVAQAKVPLPQGLLVPLGGRGGTNGTASKAQALASLNQKDLDPILDPKPACPPDRKAR